MINNIENLNSIKSNSNNNIEHIIKNVTIFI